MIDVGILWGARRWVDQRIDAVSDDRAALTVLSDGSAVGVWSTAATESVRGGVHQTDEFVVLWSGVLLNRQELARESGLPESMQTGQVLIDLWRRWEPSVLARRLHGTAMVLLFDVRRRELHGWRDKIGRSSLVYAETDHGVAASSRATAAIELADLPWTPDSQHLRRFLTRSLDTDTSRSDAIVGLERLRPAEIARWNRRHLCTIKSYWNPDTYSQKVPENAPAEFRERLLQAIASRHRVLGPHVPTMSGGIDSPSVVALYGHLLEASPHQPLQCVSMVAEEYPRVDESAQIDVLEQALPIEVQRFDISNSWTLKPGTLYGQPDLGDGPVTMPSLHWNLPFFQWARSRTLASVFMNGEGADILQFAPNSRVYRRLAQQRRLAELAVELQHGSSMRMARALARLVTDCFGVTSYVRQARRLAKGLKRRPEVPSWLRPHDWVDSPSAESGGNLGSTIGSDKIHWLMRWNWEKGARMLKQIERRAQIHASSPFLDDRLWEWVLRMPAEALRRESLHKYLGRHALARELPRDIVFRREKKVFDSLVQAGLGVHEIDFVESLFTPTSLLGELGYLNVTAFLRSYREYQSFVQRHGPGQRMTSSAYIWRVVAAEMWLQAINGQRSTKLQARL